MTTNNIYTAFQCIVYLADGKHVSQVEDCATALEAIERAAKWRDLGHIARAYHTVANTRTLELHHFPLD